MLPLLEDVASDGGGGLAATIGAFPPRLPTPKLLLPPLRAQPDSPHEAWPHTPPSCPCLQLLDAQADLLGAVDALSLRLGDPLRGGLPGGRGFARPGGAAATAAGAREGWFEAAIQRLEEEHRLDMLDGRRRHAEDQAPVLHVFREMAGVIADLQKYVAPPVRAEAAASPSLAPQYRSYYSSRIGQRLDLPEVEVAVKIYHISNVNTAQMTYDVDFTCHLDWTDPNLAGYTPEDLRGLDWDQYFNPDVQIDNAQSGTNWLPGMDEIPRLYCNPGDDPGSVRTGTPGGDGGGQGGVPRLAGDGGPGDPAGAGRRGSAAGPWLRKTMRFRGTLTLSSVSLECFPFDVHALPLSLKASRCRDVALGGTLEGSPHRDRVHLVDSGRMMRDEDYCGVPLRLRGRGHHMSPRAERGLQDLCVRSVSGGRVRGDGGGGRGDMYQVHVIVRRPLLSNHCWDLVTMNLLVVLAATSLWDASSPNLSSRMTITLMVMLSLVAFTASRPAPIEKAPYVTFHDWCEQICMLLVAGISVQNVVAVMLCGGESDDALGYMTEVFERNASQCGASWCLSRSIDCRALLLLLAVWLGLVVYTLGWLLRARRGAARRLGEGLIDPCGVKGDPD